MKVSYKWLLELTGLDWSVEEVARRLTNCGTACEEIEPMARYMDKVVVAEVTELRPIEGADKIRLATVNTGSATMELVCGAPNVAVGQKVPVAMLGAKLAGDFVIKKAKIRGIESCGMICSERELGLSDDHSGIMVLDADAPVGTPVAEQLDLADDYRLTFELTPNRPDSMSAIGIARDLAALASTTVRKPDVALTEVADRAADHISVKIEDPDACPRYTARVIRNITVGPSPWWLKKKLILSGVRPISNAVDISNLVMLETGQPLHAFDLGRFGSSEVVVRRARDKEKFTTLDGNKHDLISDVVLITNGREGVAAAGVMGGLDSEVGDQTTDILLESAYFDPSTTRRSRRHLDLVSESSTRFEKGADPNGVVYAADRAASLLADLCGGEVLSGIVDAYPTPIAPKVVTMRPTRCNKILGTSLTAERMTQIFKDLEFKTEGDDPISVTVPTFRPDIEREIDLIEEVARIEGFENIPDAKTNIGPLFTPLHAADRFQEEVRQILTGAGFDEMLGHGLAHSKKASKLNPDLPQLRLSNTSSADLDIMRNTMMLSALAVVGHNVSHRNLDLRLFEIGKVYFPPNEKGEWIEQERILLAVSGNTAPSWRERPRPYDFYDLTGALDRLAGHFHWPRFELEPAKISYFDDEVSFTIAVDGTKIGVIGRLTAKAAKSVDVKETVYMAEFETAPLLTYGQQLVEYQPLPIYPAAPRDLALVVDESVKAGDLVAAILEAGGELAESVEIFDLYTGKQIEQGKKSIAVAISYRSAEGSLSGEQVDGRQKKVVSKLKKDFNAEVRDK